MSKECYKIKIDKLPHKGRFLDWHSMTGIKVFFSTPNCSEDYFIIDSIEDNEINTKHKIYTDYYGHKATIEQCSFMKSQIGVVIGKREIGFKYDIGDIVDNRIQILERTKKKMGINVYKRYKYKCKTCGNVDWTTESVLVSCKTICNVCQGFKVLIGFNDIPSTNPWMVKYFQGGYDEAKKYTCNCSRKINFKCPDCGRIKNNKISINQLYQLKSIGCSCSDRRSYPNKFMYKMLEQMNIQFIDEYSPEWIKPKRYDFYIPSKNLIIEMDGGLGHGNSVYANSTKTKEKTIDIDKYKDNKAKEHGIFVIRIDASKSESDFLYKNIADANVFLNEELININIKECDSFATKNLLKYVCEEYEKLKPINSHQLADKLNFPQSTIHNYLTKGKKLSLCSYEGSKYKNISDKIKVKVTSFDKDMKLVKTYESIGDAAKDVGVFQSGISACIRGTQKTSGGYFWKRYEEIKKY